MSQDDYEGEIARIFDSSSDQESQSVCYDSNQDNAAFPHYPNGYPKEVFDLFRNLPEYPTSGSNEDS